MLDSARAHSVMYLSHSFTSNVESIEFIQSTRVNLPTKSISEKKTQTLLLMTNSINATTVIYSLQLIQKQYFKKKHSLID